MYLSGFVYHHNGIVLDSSDHLVTEVYDRTYDLSLCLLSQNQFIVFSNLIERP